MQRIDGGTMFYFWTLTFLLKTSRGTSRMKMRKRKGDRKIDIIPPTLSFPRFLFCLSLCWIVCAVCLSGEWKRELRDCRRIDECRPASRNTRFKRLTFGQSETNDLILARLQTFMSNNGKITARLKKGTKAKAKKTNPNRLKKECWNNIQSLLNIGWSFLVG